MKLWKRVFSILLVACMLAGMMPSSLAGILPDSIGEVKADYDWDPSDINIPLSLNGTSETRGTAMASTLEYSNYSVEWKHPKSEADLEYLLKSTKAEDTYICLTKDLSDRWKKNKMKTIEVTRKKVLDLNGHTIDWKVDSNVRHWTYAGWDQSPYQRDDDDMLMNTAIRIEEGATMYILDSSARNSYNGKGGTGRMYIHGYMLDPFKNKESYGGKDHKIIKYASFDLFDVADGNLVIYSGNFQAGRSKAMMKSNFSWSKLKHCIGTAVELAVNVANYATGIDQALAAKDDVVEQINKITSETDITPKTNSSEKKEQTTKDPDNNESLKTVGDKQDGIDKKAASDPQNAQNSSANGEQKANEKGSAKSDKDKEGNNTKIADANKKITDAVLNQDGIKGIVDKTFAFCEEIAGMLGSDHDTLAIQTHFGTVARLGTKGTFVAYGGDFKGYGSSPNTRNAVIEAHKQSKAYIFGGTFSGCAGANVFNIVTALSSTSNGRVQQVITDENGNRTTQTVTISPSETQNLMQVFFEGDGVTPVDTSNIIVRGGTFQTFYDAKNFGIATGGDKHFTYFIGTPGSVNLGIGSFNEDFIRDGRIQIADMYGDGALVLMDEHSGDSGDIYHYRLFCSDLELRYKRAYRVYPNTAKTNSSNSFALRTQYNDGDEEYASAIFKDDTENARGAYSTTEKVFYYPIKSNASKSYTVRPYFKDTDPDSTNLGTSSTWYYPDPTDTEDDPIEELILPDTVIQGTLKSDATASYNSTNPNTVTNSFNSTLNTTTTTFGGQTYVDQRTVSDTSSKNLKKVFDSYSSFSQKYNYISNMKWLEYKIYQVDPLTRLNIRSSNGQIGDDDPLATGTYGSSTKKGLKTMIRLSDMENLIKAQNTGWRGFQQGEIYRITLSVEERVNVDYNGYNQHYTNTTKSEHDDYYFTNTLNTATATSSVLFMCFGPDEKKVTEEYSTATEDFTPLQWPWDTSKKLAPDQNLTIYFRNAKTGNVDGDATRIFDVYYQWWTVDDDGEKDELIAGTTNVWDILQKYKQAKEQNLNTEDTRKLLNNGKQRHTFENWLRGRDEFQYANTIGPWQESVLEAVDISGNKVQYGEDGLPVIEYTSSGQIKNGSNRWPADLDICSHLIHAYSTAWMDPDNLKLYGGNLSNQNNWQDYGNWDSCYIPNSLAGKKIMVEAIVVNVNWTDYYDAVQTFYSHTIEIGRRRFKEPVGAETVVTPGSKGNYASLSNSATVTLGDVTGLEPDEYVTEVYYFAKSDKDFFSAGNGFKLKQGDPIPTVKFPDDFFSENELAANKNKFHAKVEADDYKFHAYILTNLDSDTADRYAETSEVPLRYEVEPVSVRSNNDSYTFDTEDIKNGKYTSGQIDLFTVYPNNYSMAVDYSKATSTNKKVAYVDADGRLAFGGSAGDATLSFTGPEGNKEKIDVKIIDYVDDIEITNINPPEIGTKNFRTDVKIPDGVDYHVKEVYWTDLYGERLPANQVARNYKMYTINVVIEKNDPTLQWRNTWQDYYAEHPATMYVETADGGQEICNGTAWGEFSYVEDSVTGYYKLGDSWTFSYDYTKAIGAAESYIDKVYMDYPTEVNEGDSVDDWMENFYTRTNGDDTEFSFKKGFNFTSYAEQTFDAYGYDVSMNDSTDTMKSFVKGTIDGPMVEISLNPEGDNVEVGFASQENMNVYVNGETNDNTLMLVGGTNSQHGTFVVPDSLVILDGKAIPVLPKYQLKDFNLAVDETVNLDDLLITDGYVKYVCDIAQNYDELSQYVEYDSEKNTLTGVAASDGALKIPLYITVDGDGDGVVDMRVNENKSMKVYATQSQADANDPIDNGVDINVDVSILYPDGTEAYSGTIKGHKATKTSQKATLDLPEIDGYFMTTVQRKRAGSFEYNYTKWTGRISANLMDGDKITVQTVDAKDIVAKTSPTEIYPEFEGVENLCVSLDGDHWTASKIAFTGLEPDKEYMLYYRQGVGDTFYTKVVRTNEEGDEYGLYVGRNPVTKSDPGNLERDHYHYDADTKTLTLKDFNFSDMGIDVEVFRFFYLNFRAQSVIYSKDDLTIELIGDNYLAKTSTERSFILGNTIRADGNITFTGDGNLTLAEKSDNVSLFGYSTTQVIQPGKGKNIYLRGTGKITFQEGVPFYIDGGGKIYYYNGEIEINDMWRIADEVTQFITNSAEHTFKIYAGTDDSFQVSDMFIKEDSTDYQNICDHYGYGTNPSVDYASTVFKAITNVHLVPNHTFDQQVASERYYVSGDCSKGTKYYKSCTCGAADHDHTFDVAKGNHKLVHHDGKAPTCIEDGYAAYDTCEKCEYTTFEKLPATGHSYVHHDEVAPTCESDGCPAYDVCSVCGYTSLDKDIQASIGILPMADDDEVDRGDLWVATGHDVYYVPEVAATCTKNGTHGYYVCSSCGEMFADEAGLQQITDNDLVIEKGHQLTYVPAVAATEEEDGHDEYYECALCGEWFEDAAGKHEITDHDSVIIPATGGGEQTIKISKTAATLAVGKTLTLTVTGGTVKTWTSDNEEVATVTSDGKVTAVAAGEATITAKLSGGRSLTCKITVVKISATSATLKAGKTKTLKVTGATVKSWATSKKTVATVTKSGKVTALTKGSATITATLEDGTKLTCAVKVSSNPTLKIGSKAYKSSTTYTVKKGKTLTVTITGKASSVKNVYSTTKKTIAKVTSKATATKVKIKGLKKGSATVTIKVNGKAFKIKVKVN